MASCYYKTRQGIIKQEEFTLSVDDKPKLPTDYSNAPIPTYKVAQIQDWLIRSIYIPPNMVDPKFIHVT
uniref:Uncharacterized protein n=1 Tax=Oryza glumipatula TaxID=40148 RepID=A0A0E0BR93_9ORYZ